jgi:methionine-rich copper-binding protein CopC
MGVYRWLILGIVSTLSSSQVLAQPVVVATKQIKYTFNSQSPQTVETLQTNFTLKADSYQTFLALIQQAEFLATSFIKQGFAQNPSLKRISVKISGERNGQEAPLLFSEVSRSNWQKQPNIQNWTKSFKTSAVLLGFSKAPSQQFTSPEVGTSNQPSATPSATDTPRQAGVRSNRDPAGFR